MLTNYFKIALRNLIKRRGYSIINIAGLAIGIAASILIYLVVTYELSYDHFHKNAKQIYQVVTQDKNEDGLSYTSGIPYIALDALRTEFPRVHFGSLYANGSAQVTIPSSNGADKKFLETPGIFFTEPQYFDIFDYTWLAGNKESLAQPNTAILNRSLAEKYFGDWSQAMGKIIRLDNALTLKIAGILEDAPSNTDFAVRIAASFITFKANPALYGYNTEWGSTTSNFQAFVLLPANMKAATFNAQLKNFSDNHYKENRRSSRLHFLQPLSAIHFDARFGNLGDHVMSKSTLWTLSFIGLLIIIMACINFINLSTAQAVGRSREVGVRKVLGGNRSQLMWQMLGETTVIVLISVLLAITIATICIPFLNKIITIPKWLPLFSPQTVTFIVLVSFLVILLSGFYPAMILSRFRPALALKNKINSASIGGISIRRGLVIVQFAISQILVVGTIVAISQMQYVNDADLGFKKEAVLVLNGSNDSLVLLRQAAFKEHLLQNPVIQSVSFESDIPSSDNNWSTNFSFNNGPDLNYGLFLKYADADYFKTFGLQLLAGRTYEQSDTAREVVINETLMKKLGVKNATQMLGKTIRTGRGAWKPIVGVVKDFKTNSLREEIKPLMIASRKKFYYQTAIKLRAANLKKAAASIQEAWEKFFPEYVYDTFFVDEEIESFYKQEKQLSTLYKIFAGLAIFISCLGLYGLVSFMAIQKTKEVGIRKVLGASVANIIYLFSKEFTLLIIIAFLIAGPVAYYMMSEWLQNFVYRIHLGADVFIGAILLSVVIAWITVGYKAMLAALVNPVKSLKSE
ncbi:MAG TPA: ABC transporter permease [Flavitalea sp.]|nr:ABC transporter permease [Flavitalea sp.]